MCTPGSGITLDRFMRVAHLLTRQRGSVAVDDYTFVNVLLWMCRTGAPWRGLPECCGKWITVCQRFDRRSGNGVIGRNAKVRVASDSESTLVEIHLSPGVF